MSPFHDYSGDIDIVCDGRYSPGYGGVFVPSVTGWFLAVAFSEGRREPVVGSGGIH